MGGLSIYFGFLTAALIAAPRRLPIYQLVALIVAMAVFVHFDVAAREAIPSQ